MCILTESFRYNFRTYGIRINADIQKSIFKEYISRGDHSVSIHNDVFEAF